MDNNNWYITGIQKKDLNENLTDVVIAVKFTKFLTVDGITVHLDSVVNLSIDESNEFIPYNDLSHEKVVEWVKLTLGKDGIDMIDQELKTKIEKIKKPKTPKFTKEFPW